MCDTNEDCVPIPECHPQECINAKFTSLYPEDKMCTRIFNPNAAYSDKDCECIGHTCLNKNRKLCKDLCGDGQCAEIVCMGPDCACAENINNCPEDCLT